MTLACPILALPQRTLQLKLLTRWEQARRSPHAFHEFLVRTNRPDGRSNVVSPWPTDRPHLRLLTDCWLAHSMILLVKSRQMLATWWAATIALWECLFHRNRLVMLQSKRLDDVVGDEHTGDGLLGRAKFILHHIPCHRLLGIQCRPLTERVTFEHTHSTMWGIPQGADIIRQRTPSGLISDECAFQDEFEDAFMAMIPAIRSGGWFCGITTPDLTDGGFTQRLYHDLADAG